MDVVLLTSAAAVTWFVSKAYISRQSSSMERFVLMSSLVSSVSLLGLSVLELLPSTWWYLWTSSISDIYRIVLWCMAVLCTVLIPSAVSFQLLSRFSVSKFQHLDHDEQKKRSFKPPKDYHWTIRFVNKAVWFSTQLVTKVAYFVVIAPIGKLLQRVCTSRDASVLPMVGSDSGSANRHLIRSYCQRPRFFRDAHFRQTVVLGSLAGTALAFVTLRVLSPLVMTQSTGLARPLLRIVSCLCAVGILLSAVMNGFGSVSLPYTCLVGLFLDPISHEAIASAEIELDKTKARLNELKLQVSSTVTRTPSATSQTKRSLWFWGKRSFSQIGDDSYQRKKLAETEVQFLGNLVSELTEDVEEMRYSQSISNKARSASGKIRSWIGVIFSVVLFIRLTSAMSNVWTNTGHQRRSDSDPVTRVLLWCVGHHFVNEQDFQIWSQFVSFLLTAFLSVSQMKNFLRTALAVRRRVRKFLQKCYCGSGEEKIRGDWLFLYVVSWSMCSYCLSCIVLTKMMLPFEYRTGFSMALGVAEENEIFKINTHTVDFVFVSTAMGSGVVLAMILGIMRSNSKRYGAVEKTPMV